MLSGYSNKRLGSIGSCIRNIHSFWIISLKNGYRRNTTSLLTTEEYRCIAEGEGIGVAFCCTCVRKVTLDFQKLVKKFKNNFGWHLLRLGMRELLKYFQFNFCCDTTRAFRGVVHGFFLPFVGCFQTIVSSTCLPLELLLLNVQ